MWDELSFRDLMTRIRGGDQQAAAELVRRYEPEIRRAVHVRLTDPALRAAFDSVDICQSVLANFFARVSLGQFRFETPQQLLNLLTTMARNKLLNRRLSEQARERRESAWAGHRTDFKEMRDPAPGPAETCAQRDLLAECRSRLTPAERDVAVQRAAGRTWNAASLGTSSEALRKQFTRACDRVAEELQMKW
jgi:DNA-directed RNA polymerase specialized sigma24 family protein